MCNYDVLNTEELKKLMDYADRGETGLVFGQRPDSVNSQYSSEWNV